MLQFLRSKTSSWAVKILLILLALTFVGWGVGDMFMPGSPDATVAEVGDRPISTLALESATRRDMQALQRQFGGEVPEVVAQGIMMRALRRLIDRELLAAAAYDAGIAIDQDTVLRQIMAEPAFHDDQGRFDRERFVQVLRASGIGEDMLVAQIRAELRRQALLTPVTAGALAPAPLVDALLAHEGETRSLAVVTIDPGALAPAEPAEGDLRTWFQDHGDAYVVPERRRVSLVIVDPDQLAAEVAVPEDELRALYEQRKGDFSVAEQREVRQIRFADADQARAAAERLDTGADFVAVAEAVTGSAPQPLGWVTRQEIPPAVSEAVFALAETGTTGPVETPFGWHIFQVLAVEPTATRGFEEVRDELRREIGLNQAYDAAYDLGNALVDALAGGASLAEAAKQLNLPLTTATIDAEGQVTPADALPPEAQRLVDEVRVMSEGEVSDPIDLASGATVVVRVDEIVPQSPMTLDQARDQVLADWRAAQGGRRATELTDALVDAVQGGQDLAAAAAARNLTVTVHDQVGRDAESLPAPVLARAFTAEPGTVFRVDDAGPGPAVAVVTDVQPAPAPNDAARAAARRELTAEMAQDLAAQYLAGLQARYGVQLNDATLAPLMPGAQP